MAEGVRLSARERILLAAYELFSKRGVRDVTVDQIVKRSGVAIATFYRQFSSKDELATEFLKRRAQVWSTDAIVAESRRREGEPRRRLLAIFDIFDEWFHRDDFEGDSFVKVLIEMGPAHPLGRASIEHLNDVRRSVEQMAQDAMLRDPQAFARSYQLLMKGAIVVAMMGDLEAARRARTMAEVLIDEYEN